MKALSLLQKGRDILKVAQLRAEAPFSVLRKASGHRNHAIAYHLRNLSERGIIQRRCFLNLARIGLQYYEICLALSVTKKESRTALVEHLRKSERVSWLGRLGGDYHFGLTLVTHSTSDVTKFLSNIFSKWEGAFFEKAVALRVSLTYFGNKYLSPKHGLREALSYGPAENTLIVDEMDQRLLKFLASNGETSAPAIARALALPASTVTYRIKRLEREKVIVGYYYHLNASRLGAQSLLLLISTKGFSTHFKDLLYRHCLNAPRITHLIHCIGAWDFEVGIDIEEAEQVTGMLDELYDQFGSSINWIKVLPMFEHLKVSEYPVMLSCSNTCQ